MVRRRITEWVIVVLIVLFFAIPVYSLSVTDSVATWPKSPTSFIYNLIFK